MIKLATNKNQTLLAQVLLAELAKRKMTLLAPHAKGGNSSPRVDLREAVPVTCALQALTVLYTDLGACNPAPDTWDLIASLTGAPWTATRVACAQCLASIGSKAPKYLLPNVRRSVEVLLTEVCVCVCERERERVCVCVLE